MTVCKFYYPNLRKNNSSLYEKKDSLHFENEKEGSNQDKVKNLIQKSYSVKEPEKTETPLKETYNKEINILHLNEESKILNRISKKSTQVNANNKSSYVVAIKKLINSNNNEGYITTKEDYIEWKITNWYALKEKRCLRSPNFRIGNYIWRIEVSVDNDKGKDFYFIDLCNVNAFGNVYVKYGFGISNCTNYSKNYCYESSKIETLNKNHSNSGIAINGNDIQNNYNDIIRNGKVTLSLYLEILTKANKKNNS